MTQPGSQFSIDSDSQNLPGNTELKFVPPYQSSVDHVIMQRLRSFGGDDAYENYLIVHVALAVKDLTEVVKEYTVSVNCSTYTAQGTIKIEDGRFFISNSVSDRKLIRFTQSSQFTDPGIYLNQNYGTYLFTVVCNVAPDILLILYFKRQLNRRIIDNAMIIQCQGNLRGALHSSSDSK